MREVTKEEFFVAKLSGAKVISINDIDWVLSHSEHLAEVIRAQGWVTGHNSLGKKYYSEILYYSDEHRIFEVTILPGVFFDTVEKYYHINSKSIFLIITQNHQVVSIETFPDVPNDKLVETCSDHLRKYYPQLVEKYTNLTAKVKV